MNNPHKPDGLLPCPFCSGRGTHAWIGAQNIVLCSKCGAEGQPFVDHADAAKAWNTRATAPTASDEQASAEFEVVNSLTTEKEAVSWFNRMSDAITNHRIKVGESVGFIAPKWETVWLVREVMATERQREKAQTASLQQRIVSLEAALRESNSLFAAMYHEKRQWSEIEKQINDNNDALANNQTGGV